VGTSSSGAVGGRGRDPEGDDQKKEVPLESDRARRAFGKEGKSKKNRSRQKGAISRIVSSQRGPARARSWSK